MSEPWQRFPYPNHVSTYLLLSHGARLKILSYADISEKESDRDKNMKFSG